MEDKITAKNKPSRCPMCGCLEVSSIFYGLPPVLSPELEKQLAKGEIVIRGCCVTNGVPLMKTPRRIRKMFKIKPVAESGRNSKKGGIE